MTASVDEPVGAVRARVADSPYGFALVVAADGTLVGRLAEQVMEAGASTVRPDRPLTELAALMRDHDLTVMLVTTPEGRLLGVLPRSLAEHTLNG